MNIIKKKILILEYDESLKESLSLILKDYYFLLFASTAKKAIKHIISRQIDLFILDIDGFSDALQIIKQAKDEYPELKILPLSINFKLSFQEKAIKIGTNMHFQEKPFIPEELLERIRTIIRGYSLKRHINIVRIKKTHLR